MVIHRRCSFWFYNSSFSWPHIFNHIEIKYLGFLSCRSLKHISVTCFTQVPLWNIPFKSSIGLNLLYFITLVHKQRSDIKTVSILEKLKGPSRSKESWFLFHCCKFTCISKFTVSDYIWSFLFLVALQLNMLLLFHLQNCIIF